MSQFTNDSVRLLIYADIDLNLIDGSAIWVASIVETLSQDAAVEPTLLLKCPPERDVVIRNIKQKENVTVINPWSPQFTLLDFPLSDTSWVENKNLSIRQATEIMEQLEYQYDMFLVRGYALSKQIADHCSFADRTWFYITDFPQNRDELTEAHFKDLETIYNNGGKLICQTPDIIEYFQSLLNTADQTKFIYLPPMIPNARPDDITFKNRHNRLVYAGKFTPLWKVPEMFQAFNYIDDLPLEFVVAGDKFHNYPYTENYEETVCRLLESSPRITWKKGLSRSEVQQLIMNADVGVSWRHEYLSTSKELSTKALEYGLYGKPVIMNRNQLHEYVFGKDYPLYANSEEEFVEKVRLVFTDEDVYRKAGERMYQVSEQHTFANVYRYLEPHLREVIEKKARGPHPLAARLGRPIRLLFAGYDLKFARHLMDYFRFNPYFQLRVDQWKGHNRHDENKSFALLDWADVVVAEWGLGNAVWYSKHKRKRQKLIVRMHRQERDTPYLHEIEWKNVDHVVLISPMLIKEFESCFRLPREKTSVFYNLVNTEELSREKLDGHRFNLGMVGIVPRMKRLDLALDVFEALWMEDPRYTLYIKGKLPNEYAWLWKRENEKQFYYDMFKRINRSPWRNAVVFDGWGNDIAEWFSKIGFVLSPSDFESFHMAVAEGMASGAVPIIRDWYGATDLYPDDYIVHSVDEAIDKIKTLNALDEWLPVQEQVKQHATRFDKRVIGGQWEEMILKLCGGQPVQGNIESA